MNAKDDSFSSDGSINNYMNDLEDYNEDDFNKEHKKETRDKIDKILNRSKKTDLNHPNPEKKKEINPKILNQMLSEYAFPFVFIGYDIHGENFVMSSCTNQMEYDALHKALERHMAMQDMDNGMPPFFM